MLLLAPEVLTVALCFTSAESELDAIDTMDMAIAGKLNGATRARATVRAAMPCAACTGWITRVRTVVFASAQDLAYGPRATFMELKMRGSHGTDGPRALGEWFSRLRSRLVLTVHATSHTISCSLAPEVCVPRHGMGRPQQCRRSAASFMCELKVCQLLRSLANARRARSLSTARYQQIRSQRPHSYRIGNMPR